MDWLDLFRKDLSRFEVNHVFQVVNDHHSINAVISRVKSWAFLIFISILSILILILSINIPTRSNIFTRTNLSRVLSFGRVRFRFLAIKQRKGHMKLCSLEDLTEAFQRRSKGSRTKRISSPNADSS